MTFDPQQDIDHAEHDYHQPCPACGGPKSDDVHAEGCPLDPAADLTGITCGWWALCANAATGWMPHPILGQVAICDRCREKHDRIGAARQPLRTDVLTRENLGRYDVR